MKKQFRTVTAAALMMALIFSLISLPPAAHAGAYDPDLKASEDVRSGINVYPAKIINDFNTPEDVATWRKGENTKSISYVTSIQNGPGSVAEGSGALEQQPNPVKVYEWRTIYRDFGQPLDLSGYRYLAFSENNWGWQPADYMLRIRLHSPEGIKESYAKVKNDAWSHVFIDISSWKGSAAVTKLEISFMHNFDLEKVEPGAPGYDSWGGRFQIDRVVATNVMDMQFNTEGDTEGFTAASGTVKAAGGQLQWQLGEAGDALSSGEFALPLDQRNALSVKLANATPAAALKLSWTTAEDPEYSEEKSQIFEVEPGSPLTTYDFNLSGQPAWKGTLRSIRLEPVLQAGEGGAVQIDGVEFKQMPALPPAYIGSLNSASISANGSIKLDGTVKEEFLTKYPDGQLQLYEMPTYADPAKPDAERTLLDSRPLQASFAFEAPLKDADRSRLYSKFGVAVESGGELQWVDAPQYIVNPELIAPNTYDFPEAKSKKGLQVQFTDDAEDLGISHAALNVAYDQMLYLTNSKPDNTIPYEFQGKTYYFKKSTVLDLDRRVKSLSDNDTIVSLILIMYRNLDPNTPNSILIHPDSEPNGTVYAVNTKTAEGVGYYSAVTNFLAERYTRADEAYGRAVNYIVGNEVGENKTWNNMGPKTIYEYVEDYARTLRLTDTIVRSNYSQGRVYVSLDHFWETNLPSDSLWKYDNKDLVELLSKDLKQQGDIPWHMAFHPYPENLMEPRFWNDKAATDSFETEQITFKNLQVLVDYLRQPAYLYNGEPRRIILSEQGFHSLDNTLESQQIQAAAYAYAYYKVKFLDGIDSFILHRHVDHAQEGGLNLGLWTNLKGEIATPDQKKVSYNVFRDIDTAQSLAATDFAKKIIGIQSWNDVIPNFDAKALADRAVPFSAPVSLPKKAKGGSSVADFENGTGGWTLADNSSSIQQTNSYAYEGNGALQVNFDEIGKIWRGADVKLAEAVDAAKSPALNLALKVNDAAAQKPYYAKIKVYSGAQSAEGVVALNQPGEWEYVSMDLSGWTGVQSIDRVKVWMNTPTTDRWRGSFLIDSVSFAKPANGQEGQVNLDIAAKLGVDGLQAGSALEVTVTNYDDKDLTGNIQVTSEAVRFSSDKLHVNKIKPGESKTFTLTVEEYTPPAQGSVNVTFKYRNTEIVKALAAVKDNGEGTVPAGEKLLYNFENSAEGWKGASRVASAGPVQSFPNAPGTPKLGSYVLNVKAEAAAATEWKSVKVTPATPIDMSQASRFFYYIDSYGGVPNATYETRAILTASDGSTRTIAAPSAPDSWSRIEGSIADWEGRGQVASVEIGFRAVGNTMAWQPEFQLDYIGYAK